MIRATLMILALAATAAGADPLLDEGDSYRADRYGRGGTITREDGSTERVQRDRYGSGFTITRPDGTTLRCRTSRYGDVTTCR